MELNRDTYDLICEQMKQCLLPELDREIGNEQLVKEDFGIFRYGLEMNLQLLFDIIANNERIILEPYDDDDNTFRINFILLVHQQSGYDEAPFQTDNESISKQFRLLTEKYYKKLATVPEIYKECLKYYKERLTADKWKRNVGAVYGFVQMNKLNQRLIQSKLKSDECLFMLSVAMHLVDYFETIYKKLGLILFNILLDFGNASDLKLLNLYEVIFKKIMNPLINVLTDEITTILLLSCLYKCIKMFDGWHNPSKWNEVDDVLDEILKRIAFESDNRCVAILYLFVTRLTTLPMKTPQMFNDQTDFENLDKLIAKIEKSTEKGQSERYDKLRNIFCGHHNLLIGRWSKKLMEVITHRAIIGKPNEIRFQIHVLHVCYLSCFYGNPLFIRMKWSDFLHEIVMSMMQLVKNNVNRNVFISEIFDLLETFKQHLLNANPRIDLLEPFKHELEVSEGVKEPEKEKADPKIDEIERDILTFINSLNDITIDLKSYCETKSSK